MTKDFKSSVGLVKIGSQLVWLNLKFGLKSGRSINEPKNFRTIDRWIDRTNGSLTPLVLTKPDFVLDEFSAKFADCNNFQPSIQQFRSSMVIEFNLLVSELIVVGGLRTDFLHFI